MAWMQMHRQFGAAKRDFLTIGQDTVHFDGLVERAGTLSEQEICGATAFQQRVARIEGRLQALQIGALLLRRCLGAGQCPGSAMNGDDRLHRPKRTKSHVQSSVLL